MKKAFAFAGIVAMLTALIFTFWTALFFIFTALGFSNQATPQYGFTSGVGPMLLTALGMSTLTATVWHSLNCHEDGCLRIGRHRVNGTPWCNVHHEKARTVQTESQQLARIIELLEKIHGDK